MKTITFPTIKIFKPKDQLHSIISDGPMNAGYTIAEVRDAMKVLEKIDNMASDESKLVLEDAEHQFVIRRMQAQRWTVANSEIIAFTDAIENAT